MSEPNMKMTIYYVYMYGLTDDERNQISSYVAKISPQREPNLAFFRDSITFQFQDCDLLFGYTKYIAKIMNKNRYFIDDKDIENKGDDFSLFVWS